MSTDDKPLPGRLSSDPTNEIVEKIHKIILEVRRRTIEKVENLFGLIWLDLWQSSDWIFHHDIASAYRVLSLHQFLNKNCMTSVPLYSLGLSSCDFFNFSK